RAIKLPFDENAVDLVGPGRRFLRLLGVCLRVLDRLVWSRAFRILGDCISGLRTVNFYPSDSRVITATDIDSEITNNYVIRKLNKNHVVSTHSANRDRLHAINPDRSFEPRISSVRGCPTKDEDILTFNSRGPLDTEPSRATWKTPVRPEA